MTCRPGQQPVVRRYDPGVARRPLGHVTVAIDLPGLVCARRVGLALAQAIRQQSNRLDVAARSEEHTSELQSLMRISYAVFCLIKINYLYSSSFFFLYSISH